MVMLAVVLWIIDGFGGGDGDAAALRLRAHVAAGCMQLHARVLHRCLLSLASPSEEADAVLHGPRRVALAPAGWHLSRADGGWPPALPTVWPACIGDGAWGAGDQVGSVQRGMWCSPCCAVPFRLLMVSPSALITGNFSGGRPRWAAAQVRLGVGGQGLHQFSVALQLALCFAGVGGFALAALGATSTGVAADVQA